MMQLMIQLMMLWVPRDDEKILARASAWVEREFLRPEAMHMPATIYFHDSIRCLSLQDFTTKPWWIQKEYRDDHSDCLASLLLFATPPELHTNHIALARTIKGNRAYHDPSSQ